jgi:hypothetical protein
MLTDSQAGLYPEVRREPRRMSADAAKRPSGIYWSLLGSDV